MKKDFCRGPDEHICEISVKKKKKKIFKPSNVSDGEMKADADRAAAFQTSSNEPRCCLTDWLTAAEAKPIGPLLFQPKNPVSGPLIREPLNSQSHFWLPNTFTTLPAAAAAIIINIITPL